MATTVMIYNNPTLKVAVTQAGLTTGLAAECQVNSAVISAAPTYNTIPSTGCSGATQSPGITAYNLDLAWLQDWKAAAAMSLSKFASDNDGKTVWFELQPDKLDNTVKATGSCFCAAGSFGGTFGDGSAAASTATWPLIGKPTFTSPATMEATEGEPAEAAA